MAGLALTFPVFYCCAIKGRSSLNQHDILNILFLGKYSDECDAKYIAPSVGSGYVNGKRALSKELISTLCRSSYDELESRFRKLALQDCESSAENLRLFLTEMKPMGEFERNRLLGIAQAGGPYKFLIEAFLSSIKSPPGATARLDAHQQRCLQAGGFEELKKMIPADEAHETPHDDGTQPEFAEQGTAAHAAPGARQDSDTFSLKSRIVEHFDGQYSEFEFRERRLFFPDDLDIVSHYADAFLEGSVPPVGVRNPSICLNASALTQFTDELSRFMCGHLVEALGNLEQLGNMIPRLKTLLYCQSVLILMDISPETSISDIQELNRAIKNVSHYRPLRLHCGARVTGKLISTVFLRMIYADIPLPRRPQQPSRPPQAQARIRRRP